MRLHYWPRTRAFRILCMLEEIGAPYELVPVNIRDGGNATEAFLRINPLRKIPVLEDAGTVIADSTAIALWLVERYPDGSLGPAPGEPDRGRFLTWAMFATAYLEPAMVEKFAGIAPNPMAYGWGSFERVRETLEAAVSAGPWVMGERYSAADVLIATALDIAFGAKILDPAGPLGPYAERFKARPAIRRAAEIEAERYAALVAPTLG